MLAACMALIDEPNDKEKFLEIYNTYRDHMYKVAMSILHNEALADETVQDCFLRIAVNIADIPDVRSKKFRALLVIMVRNKAINNLGSEHYDTTSPLDEGDVPPDDFIKDIYSSIGYNQLMQEISNLKIIYKDALTLRFLYGYGIDQICSILGISKKTAEMRIYRGKKILKERMGDDYGDRSQIK